MSLLGHVIAERQQEFRAFCLGLDGSAAIDMQGWLIGVAMAMERANKTNPQWTDDLMKELRASKGPPIRSHGSPTDGAPGSQG